MPPALAWLLRFISADLASIYSKLGHSNLYETAWPDVYRYVHSDLTELVKSSMESMLEREWVKPSKRAGKRSPCFSRSATA